MKVRRLEVSEEIWKDKRIPKVTNLAFKKNLQQLEKYNYIKFNEYANGLYEYHIC